MLPKYKPDRQLIGYRAITFGRSYFELLIDTPTMLHIVSRSPFSSTALYDCISHASKDCAILLIGSGVYALEHPHLINSPSSKIYAIYEDAQSRGLDTRTDIRYIDYAEMVSLTAQHHPILTWN